MKILGIDDSIEQDIISIAIKNDIKKLILFGSRARGDFKRTSDIDLAVEGGNISAFAVQVDEEVSILLEFDIINLDGRVQKELLESIRREGVLLYEKI
jgi:predicted nucleotidyltransferase